MTNIFDRVVSAANICRQFKVECANNDFGQQRYIENRRGSLNTPEKLGANEYICHILCDDGLHEQFFVCRNFYSSSHKS